MLCDLRQIKEVCYVAIDAAEFASSRLHEHKSHRHAALRADRRRGILGHGFSLSPRRELNTLSHRQQPKARNGDKSPCAFNGPIASQFRAIDTVLRHSAISSLDRRSHFRSAGSELRLAASHSNDQHCLASTVAQLHPISSLPISDVCSWHFSDLTGPAGDVCS